MSHEEGQQILEDAEKAGADYAHEQISSSYFGDWVRDQLAEAEQMRQRDPASVLPLETPADARKLARNMFQTLKWDTQRQLDRREMLDMAGAAGVFEMGSRDWVRDTYGITEQDVGGAFFDGFDEVLHKPATIAWLVDEILLVNEGMRHNDANRPGHRTARGRTRARKRVTEVRDYPGGGNTLVVYFSASAAGAYQRGDEIGQVIESAMGYPGLHWRVERFDRGWALKYGPIDPGDYRKIEGALYRKFGNAVRVSMEAGSTRRVAEPPRSVGPMPGWTEPAPAWAARVVIIEGDARRPWSAKVYDKNGNVRSGSNDWRREYVEKWAETYFPGVPVERESPQRAPARRSRRSR